MQFRKVTALFLALFVTGGGLHAQKILVGADFATRFDNREYANNDFNESQTLFSARLSPRVGVEWMEKNRKSPQCNPDLPSLHIPVDKKQQFPAGVPGPPKNVYSE